MTLSGALTNSALSEAPLESDAPVRQDRSPLTRGSQCRSGSRLKVIAAFGLMDDSGFRLNGRVGRMSFRTSLTHCDSVHGGQVNAIPSPAVPTLKG